MKFLERKYKVIYTGNSFEFGKSFEEFFGIIVRQRHTDQKLMELQKERCASERRDIFGAVAIRSGQRVVGGFYGMLHLSAKHSRSLV